MNIFENIVKYPKILRNLAVLTKPELPAEVVKWEFPLSFINTDFKTILIAENICDKEQSKMEARWTFTNKIQQKHEI